VVGDLAARLATTLGLLAVASAAWVAAVERLEAARAFPAPRLGALILLGAVALRLPLLALPPTLSDDVLRYAWDGRVAASGADPYTLAPDDPALAPQRDELWRRLPHRDVPTVYPPLALTAFGLAALTARPILALKGLAAAADLAACAGLVALARRRRLPAARAAWYAWSPLVALEGAGMGHVDALAAAAAVAAVLALSPRPGADGTAAGRRALRAGAAAAAGVLAKLAPLAALPLWARASGRPGRFLLVALGLTAAGLAPMLIATGGLPSGLVTYAVSWEFGGPLFEPLWRLLAAAGAAPLAARLLAAAEALTGWHEALDAIYPYLYPQLLAKAALAAAFGAVVARSAAWSEPVAGSRRLFAALLLCSATVYPWYLLWVLPWAALTRSVPWLAAAALAPLLYLPQLREVALFPWIWLAVWGPVAALAVLAARRRTP
jgi:hypothetical protein